MKRFNRLKIAFGITILLWVLLILFKAQLNPFCEKYLGEGFLTSYSASLLEDVIFFGLIGYITIYVTTKLPEDENLNTRIKALANNKSVGEKAKHFLFEYVKKFLVYSSQNNAILIIKEYDKVSNSIKIFCDFSGDYVNMCKDEVYTIFNFAFIVEPNEKVENSYGYISYLGIEEINSDNKNVVIQNDIFELKNIHKYEKYINFDISKNSSANWKMSFATWGKLNTDRQNDKNWFFLRCRSFTESFTAVIKNETSIDIKCDVRYLNRDENSKSKKVENNGIISKSKTENTILGNNIVFHQKDKFEIFFYI
jgi:hypothetical protein